ncbi:MAG TPA: NifB/NifX family molybdenum-iron cluster-binding protein [Methylomusa anaerophila]|uniref:Dinitrogenase iron-molybdenum cofactor n=1 Tax=Methylomusa anaerophila TaxID=1930071 RepID=A0A348AF01_9FIRM|nr:NifB/NifX family molybdenum-iron cluster-binding protein [Methylomusa anaerophila]BBB89649.1 dinitrogenase iron-molybdenum cofactor [Methylomusa anaerophila]HML89575.1 NifB/NifX family molybdenum-iron cluster-binding protein [Methylomusa anaerophila]
MKIAITSHGDVRQAAVDSRFGRAAYFMVYDQENGAWESFPNTQNLEAAHGAGIQSAQTLAKAGAGILITGYVGPKAYKVLTAGKVEMYSSNDTRGTVEDVLAAFLDGKLSPIAAPNALDINK